MSQQEMADKVQSMAAEVIDRIAEDEEFREALKANPEGAMRAAGFYERVEQLGEEVEGDAEVAGFASFAPRIGGIRINTLAGGTIVASSPPSNAPTCGCPAGFVGSRFVGR